MTITEEAKITTAKPKKIAEVKEKLAEPVGTNIKKPRRSILRASHIRNSELKQIADILTIRTPTPRSQKQREELLRKIRKVLT